MQENSSPNHRFVVLGSANGSRNLGDESMWEALAKQLRKLSPSCQIITDGPVNWQPPIERVEVLPLLAETMIFDRKRSRLDPKRPSIVLRALSKLRRIERAKRIVEDRTLNGPRNQLEFLWHNAIKEADVLLISGAGAMTDQYALHGIHSWLLLATWANQCGKPVVLVGQGVGPVENEVNRDSLRKLLELSSYVGVRDPISATFVEDLVPQMHGRVEVTPDWATALEVSDLERADSEELLEGYFPNKRAYITLSVHLHRPLAFFRKARLKRLTRSVVRAAKASGFNVLFIPNMTGKGHSDDRATAGAMVRALPRELRDICAIHDGQSDAARVRALIGKSEGLVTTRYHPLVFSLLEETPSIGIYFDDYYKRKLIGASKNFSVTNNVVSFDQALQESNILGLLDSQDPPVFDRNLAISQLVSPLRNVISGLRNI